VKNLKAGRVFSPCIAVFSWAMHLQRVSFTQLRSYRSTCQSLYC